MKFGRAAATDLTLISSKKKSSSVLKATFSPQTLFFLFLLEVINTFLWTGRRGLRCSPPLPPDPLEPAQQLFTGEAAGSKPMRGFMQIECTRYFDESRLARA